MKIDIWGGKKLYNKHKCYDELVCFYDYLYKDRNTTVLLYGLFSYSCILGNFQTLNERGKKQITLFAVKSEKRVFNSEIKFASKMYF